MSTAPVSRGAIFSWNPETVKTNIKHTTDTTLDTANGIAKKAIDPLATASVAFTAKASGEVLKKVVETNLPEGLSTTLKTAIDASVLAATTQAQQTIAPKLNNCVDLTTNTSKNVAHKSTDASVDCAHKISQRSGNSNGH